MMKASDIMTKDVATIRSSATVAEAVMLMQARGWRSLIVERWHEQDAYGIITETDIVYKVVSRGQDPHKIRVHEIMTKPCIVVNPDLGVEYVARLFADNGLVRAPVIQGELLGIISVSDILNKSNFMEQPLIVLLEQDLEDAIKEAYDICGQKGPSSTECSIAWGVVETLQSEIAHQQAGKISKTAFEEYCEDFPEAREARMLDNLCTGKSKEEEE
jgi:CBS domain-containing protein